MDLMGIGITEKRCYKVGTSKFGGLALNQTLSTNYTVLKVDGATRHSQVRWLFHKERHDKPRLVGVAIGKLILSRKVWDSLIFAQPKDH